MFNRIDVCSEFTLSLLSVALALLRLRVPRILDRPSLLAHTIYQTIVFDDAVRQGGFDIASTVAGRRAAAAAAATENGTGGAGQEWQGLTGMILRDSGWYEHWVKGEKQCKLSRRHL
jgi:hypothetical protein